MSNKKEVQYWLELRAVCDMMIEDCDNINYDVKTLSQNLPLALELLKYYKSEQGLTHTKCINIYSDFIQKLIGVKPKIDGLAGKAMKDIIAYLRSLDKIKSDEDVIRAFEFVLVNYDAWDNFYKQQTKLNQINSNFQNILNNIRNGVKKTNKSDREKRVDAVDELQRRAIEILEGNKE